MLRRISDIQQPDSQWQSCGCLERGSGRINVDCTGFPPIQLLTNAECSINPACSLFFLVLHLRKNSLRKKNKDICWGRQDMAGSGESGNIDCKPACQGAIDLDQQYALRILANIYPQLFLCVKQYPSEELQLLSQHLFLMEPLTFGFKQETTIKGCAQMVRRDRDPGSIPAEFMQALCLTSS